MRLTPLQQLTDALVHGDARGPGGDPSEPGGRSTMELRDYLAIGRRWLWLFALASAVAAVGAWVGTRFMPNTYRSSTTLMVGSALDNPEVSAQSIYLSNQLATAYAQMATREPVLEGVVNALDLPVGWEALKGMIKAQPQPGSPMLEISVVATRPEVAQALASEAARQLIASTKTAELLVDQKDASFLQAQIEQLRGSIEQVQPELEDLQAQLDTATSARQISELQSRMAGKQAQLNEWRSRYAEMRTQLGGSVANSLTIIESATPGQRVGPNVRMNVLLAALLGLGLALTAVLILEYLDDTVKNPELIERRLGLVSLAAIMRFDDVERRADGLVALHAPRSPMSEVYRTLRTNISFALLQRDPGPLVVTSVAPGEGKSTTAANLATVFAQSGKRVALVDGDLRKPSLHRFFGLSNSYGLTNLMLDPKLDTESMLQDIEALPDLRLLTSGPLPPNPAEILGSDRTARILQGLQHDFDLVIVDSPPVMLVTDPVVLSMQAAGTLLVLDANTTRVDAARKALETLARSGITPIGAVVNKLESEKAGGYYRYAYSSYQSGYGDYFGGGDGGDGGPDGRPQPPDGQRPRAPQPGLAGLRDRIGAAISGLLS